MTSPTDNKGPMDQFSAHLDRGWDLVSRGDFAGALVSAQKSLEVDPESPEAHNLMGYVQAAEGNADEALDHYKQAIDLDDTFVEAMLNAAEVLIHPMQDYRGALKMVEDALDFCETDDEVADAMLLRIDALLQLGEREEASRTLAALPQGPFENPHLEFMIGRAMYELDDAASAEPRIRRAVEIDPNHAESQYYLGLVLEAKGDTRGATVAFLRCRELDLDTAPVPWSIPLDQFERRVQAAVRRLGRPFQEKLEGALVVVVDVPGAEVVAEGVDPRVLVLLDEVTGETSATRVGRLFVYQRSVERIASGLLDIEDEVRRALERELAAVFPDLAKHLSEDVAAEAAADDATTSKAKTPRAAGRGGSGSADT